MVEPTDHSELESGNPHWTKQCSMSSNLEEEEEEDSSADTTDSTADGQQKQDMAIEDGYGSSSSRQMAVTCSWGLPQPTAFLKTNVGSLLS